MGVTYDATVRGEDTERAAATLRPHLVPNGERPRLVRLEGECPRCGHPTSWEHRLTVVAGAAVANDSLLDDLDDLLDKYDARPDSWDVTIDARCRCAHEHKGCPAATAGCGSSFRVRVVWP